MNIIVKTADSRIYVRPDTTWEKNSEDLFVPPFIDRLSFTPVLFARICKPGRSITAKFASRYYDGINYGLLLYPDNIIETEGMECAACIDHTSYLPIPLYGKITLGREDNVFLLKQGRKKLFSYNEGGADLIEQAICEASARTFLRTGDNLAIELAPRQVLWKREDGTITVKGSYCGNDTLEFKIVA